MRKRIAFLLSIIAVVLMLSACGTDPTKVDYNGKTYKQLYDECVNAGTLLKDYSVEEIEEQLAEPVEGKHIPQYVHKPCMQEHICNKSPRAIPHRKHVPVTRI